MTDLWSDLLSTVKVDAGPTRTRFCAANQHLEYHRIFGGQLLARFIRAATLICPEKSVKSMHTTLPREGRSDEPLEYAFTVHHEGRSFATLTATAHRSSGPIGAASISKHVVDNGPTSGPPEFELWMRTPPVNADLPHGRGFGRGDVLTARGPARRLPRSRSAAAHRGLRV